MLFLLDPMQPVRVQLDDSGEIQMSAKQEVRPLAVRLRSLWWWLHKSPRGLWHELVGAVRRSTASQWLAYQLVHWHGRCPTRFTRMFLPENRWPAFWYTAGRLAKGYVARPYVGRTLTVFAAKDERFRVWMDLIGGLAQVTMVNAAHTDMFNEPALTEWMQRLDRVLAADAPD